MSQKARIWEYMRNGHAIDPITALNMFGCYRLAARICELRREGKPIVGEPHGNHFVYRAGLIQ